MTGFGGSASAARRASRTARLAYSGGSAPTGTSGPAARRRSPTWAGTPTTGSAGSSTSRRSCRWPTRSCTAASPGPATGSCGSTSAGPAASGTAAASSWSTATSGRTACSWLTDWLHRHGLLAGIYTDAGKSGCHGQGVGSLGHYQQDADQLRRVGLRRGQGRLLRRRPGRARRRGRRTCGSRRRSRTTRATARCC